MLFEVLVVPFRAGDLDLAKRYETLLTRSRGVELADIDRDVLRGAANLRARIPAIPGLGIVRLDDVA